MKIIIEIMRVVDDEGNIIKIGDFDIDVVSGWFIIIIMVVLVNFFVGWIVVIFVLNRRMFEFMVDWLKVVK